MSTVIQIIPTALRPMTLSILSDIVQDVLRGDKWLLGDDSSTIATVATDLAILTRIMDAGLRDDATIRTEATRLARMVQKRAKRDFAAGLIDADAAAMSAVMHPDDWERLIDRMEADDAETERLAQAAMAATPAPRARFPRFSLSKAA
jgi:hypothetical protein